MLYPDYENAQDEAKESRETSEAEFNFKVKQQADHLGMQLQDLTTMFFNSVLHQTEIGKAITDDLMSALRQLNNYREVL